MKPARLDDLNPQPLGPRILLLGGLLFLFLLILGKPLSYRDEVRIAGIAREMGDRGEWALPRLNGEPFLEYPSLGYLPQALLLKAAGKPVDFLVLLPTALWGWGTLIVTYLLGRRLGGRRVGMASGAVLLCTVGFVSLHNRALVDPALLFWITVSMFGLLRCTQEPDGKFFPCLLFYGGMGCAFLCKGLLGLGIPGATAFFFLLFHRDGTLLRRLRPVAGIMILLVLIGVWSFGVFASGGSALLSEVWTQSVYRFTSSRADHAGPFYYYFKVAPVYLAPWSLLLPLLIWRHYFSARMNVGRSTENTDLLPRIWFAVVFIGLSIASAKRNLYLAPIFPAFALLVGLWWGRLYEGMRESSIDYKLAKIFLSLGPFLLLGGGLVFLIRFGDPSFLTLSVVETGSKAATWFGFILMPLGGLALWIQKRHGAAFASLDRRALLFLACFLPLFVGWHFLLEVPRTQTESLEEIESWTEVLSDPDLVLIHPNEVLRGATYYYGGRVIPTFQYIEELQEALKQKGGVVRGLGNRQFLAGFLPDTLRVIPSPDHVARVGPRDRHVYELVRIESP